MPEKPKGCCDKVPVEYPPATRLSDTSIFKSKPDLNGCGISGRWNESNQTQRDDALCAYVVDFINSPGGPVPRVHSRLTTEDHWGMLRVRLGIGRNRYAVAPGLYAIGCPDPDAPVFVTANYKLSFDHLRAGLKGIDAWILVLDTRGINVWCAAGKKTFSTNEIIFRVVSSGLGDVVRHRRLILPQLGATGAAAYKIKKGCGFEVVWGPIRATDIQAFVSAGMKADSAMRQLTFSFWERLILVPVEISMVLKHLIWLCLAIFIVSGIGGDLFSLHLAWSRGLALLAASFGGVLAGAVVVPALLPYIPSRPFSLKGTITGILAGLGIAWMLPQAFSGWEALALILWTTTLSSYLAMNFTGATPFTSPSGVEKEMRRAIPLQVAAVMLTLIIWIAAAFAG